MRLSASPAWQWGGRLSHLSFSDARGENQVQRGFQTESNCVAPSDAHVFSPVDCVSEKSVLVIQHAKETSKKKG